MSDADTASFAVFHNSGIKVFFTLQINPLLFDEALKDASAAIALALSAGYTVNAVGLLANEEREDIGWVLRYNHVNDRDGSITPRIFFYPANEVLVRKDCSYYLNTDEDIAEFERVSGLKLSTMSAWLVGGAPNRDDANARQFIIPVKNRFAVIKKPNEKYQGEGDKKNTKHLFVRYETSTPTNVTPFTPPANPTPQTPAQSSPASTERTGSNGESANGLKVIDGSNPSSFDELFPETMPAAVGKLDMIAILNRAVKEKLVKNKPEFDKVIRLLLHTEQIAHTFNTDEILDALRRNAEKELEKAG